MVVLDVMSSVQVTAMSDILPITYRENDGESGFWLSEDKNGNQAIVLDRFISGKGLV